MTVLYTVEISDVDYRSLCYVTDRPNEYVDEHVTEYISQMKRDLIKDIIKSELKKPGTRSIPADKEQLLAAATVKSAAQINQEDTARMVAMVQNPDAHDSDIGESVDLPD
jgi:hypothetical protein|tara:strand:- start:16455 stop:16784 length:330 start_codon:yes stop_codon:yes gene_type:complete